MNVLVDSSVWIEADKKSSTEHLKLKKLIADSTVEISVCRPICVEVCQGARTAAEFEHLWSGFLGFKDLVISEGTWLQSAKNFMYCRKKGIAITTIDCLIATLASEYSAYLWSRDKIFLKVSHVLMFELWR